MFKAVSEKKDDCDNVFENIPLDKSAVEQIFINMGLSVYDILNDVFPKSKNETDEEYSLRIMKEWKNLWKERAFSGSNPIYVHTEGSDSADSQNFQWVIIKQNIENNNLVSVPVYAEQPFIDGIQLKERSDGINEDFKIFGEEWLTATKELFSENKAVTLFRYQLGSGPKPSKTISFSATETCKFSLPISGTSKFVKENGRILLGKMHCNTADYVKQLFTDAKQFESKQGVVSRCLWGKSIQASLSKLGLYVVKLTQLDKSQKNNLMDCFSGYNLSENIIDEMFNSSSNFYSEELQEPGDETKAYVAGFALVDNSGQVEAAIWCQDWESTLEGATLKVNCNAGIERPYFKQENVSLINNAIMHSLYIRAAGSRTGVYKRASYLLELFTIVELSNRSFNGIIARIPKISKHGLPNFSTMSEQVQIFGLQRAMTLSSIIDFKKEDDPRDSLISSLPSETSAAFLSTEALEVFDFHKEPPFYFTLSEIFSKPAFMEAKTKSKTFFDHPNCTMKTWKDCSKNSGKLQKFLKAFFSVRIYPTSSQILGMYGILTELLKASQNNLLSGIVYEVEEDGQLTELENRAIKNNDVKNLWGLK